MKGSLGTSLALHASILVAALVVLPDPNPYKIKPQESIQVDISKIGDTQKIKATAKDADTPVEKPKGKKAEVVRKSDPTAKIAEKEQKAAKQAKPKEEPPKPKDEPKKVEEPTPLDPDPLKDLIKDTVTAEDEAAKLAEKKKVEDQKKAAEKKKADEKKKAEEKKAADAKKAAEAKKLADAKKQQKLDVAKLEDILNSDNLLNKENEEKTTNASEATEDGNPAKGEANLQGNDDELVGTIVDGLVSRVKECWSVPPGAREANITVRIHFQLNPDGTLAAAPEVTNGVADPIFDATARSAVAALIECQSYGFLPAERYDLWKDNTLDFNPNLMFQG